MRAMRCGRRAHQHAPHPQAIRYRPAWETTKGALGEDHGGTVEKEVARLPGLPHADPRRALRRTSTLKCPLESRVRSKPQARFGGGRLEKGRWRGTSLAAYPTASAPHRSI